jgi:hypothetical protein
MKKILLMVAILSALVMIIPTSGCSGSTRVGDILANPMNFEGKQVSIRGTVGETVWLSFLKKGAYQIGDGSGIIWIVTPQPPPQKGTVSAAFKLEDRTLGTVITEIQRD